MSASSLPKIALSTGDPAGIGPEICLKAATSAGVRRICLPLVIGDPGVLEEQARLCGIPWKVKLHGKVSDVDWEDDSVAVLVREQFTGSACAIGEVNAENGRSAIDSASTAIAAALAGEVHAVVAAPHTQTSIAEAGISFDGYPGFVARETGLSPDEVFLMLCFNGKKIAHCTLHVSVRNALEMITANRVKNTIYAVHSTLLKLEVSRPKIMVSGINPHAGENRLFGNEDADIIAPTIKAIQSEGVDVRGPVGADLILHNDHIDAFIVMFHDQGHIPAKLMAPRQTIAMTIGSPILFSSVAHGSALDIAGRGIADPSALIEAIKIYSF